MQNYNLITDLSKKELIDHGDSFFPLAGYDEFFSGFPLNEVPWHWHNELELVVVLTGSTKVEYVDGSLLLDSGDGIFINTSTLHRMKQIGDIDCHIISFVLMPEFLGGRVDSKIFNEYIKPICSNKSLDVIKFSPKLPWENDIINNILSAFDMYTKRDFCYEIAVKSMLLQAWRILCINKSDLLLSNQYVSESRIRLDNIIKYIHENYNQKLTVSKLSSIANISESECYRLFKKLLNLTPIDYLLTYRLNIAAIKLLESNASILEVSLDSGFGSSSYFSKKFKNLYSLTPKEFRKYYTKP